MRTQLLASALLGTIVSSVVAGPVPHPAQSRVLPMRRRHNEERSRPWSATMPLRAASYDLVFDVEITIGGQNFLVIADTGSADLWGVGDGFECIDSDTGLEIPQKDCLYTKTYHQSSTYEKTPDETFGVQYGTGVALGDVATEKMSFAGFTVEAQTFGVVKRTDSPGSGIDSGILGLGYPILTSAHPGDSIADNTTLLFDRILYSPLIQSMAAQGPIDPWFSFAIGRLPRHQKVGPGGYLAIADYPPVEYSPDFAVAPVEITEAIPLILTNNTAQITEWTLTVPTVFWGPAGNKTKFRNATAFQATLDTGNMFHQLPQEVVDGVHAQYHPAPALDADSGVYIVDCDVQVPKLGVTIAGQTFYHLDEDLVLYNFLGDGRCVSALRPSATGDGVALNFLGDPLFRNTVAAFDFGKNEMRFSARADGGGSIKVKGC